MQGYLSGGSWGQGQQNLGFIHCGSRHEGHLTPWEAKSVSPDGDSLAVDWRGGGQAAAEAAAWLRAGLGSPKGGVASRAQSSRAAHSACTGKDGTLPSEETRALCWMDPRSRRGQGTSSLTGVLLNLVGGSPVSQGSLLLFSLLCVKQSTDTEDHTKPTCGDQ